LVTDGGRSPVYQSPSAWIKGGRINPVQKAAPPGGPILSKATDNWFTFPKKKQLQGAERGIPRLMLDLKKKRRWQKGAKVGEQGAPCSLTALPPRARL